MGPALSNEYASMQPSVLCTRVCASPPLPSPLPVRIVRIPPRGEVNTTVFLSKVQGDIFLPSPSLPSPLVERREKEIWT